MTSSAYDKQKQLIPEFFALSLISFLLFSATLGSASALGAAGFGLMMLLSFSLIWLNTRMLLAAFLVSLLFQSSMISFFSVYFESRSELSISQGLTFLLLAVGFCKSYLYFLSGRLYIDDFQVSVFRKWAPIISVICLFYFFLGALLNGAIESAIYLRSSISVLFLICFGYYTGKTAGWERFSKYYIYIAFAAITFGYLEITIPRQIYSLIHADDFFALKYDGRYVITGIEDLISFAQRPFLNLAILKELNLQTFRISGPNLHSISFAYFLGVTFIFAITQRRHVLAFLALLLMLAIQSKGPFIVIFFSIFILFTIQKLPKIIHAPMILSASLLYITATIMIGIAVRDFHVIGLIGGFNGFLSNPIGHGLGAGGNLARESFEWQDFQNAGAAAFGVESAVGVLLYQIGIATIPVIFFYVLFCVKSFHIIRNSERYNLRLLPIMMGVTVINGLFQEEAYNTFALGLISFIVSAAMGSSKHTTPRKIKDGSASLKLDPS